MDGFKSRSEVESQVPCTIIACIDLPLYEVEMPVDVELDSNRVMSSMMDGDSTVDGNSDYVEYCYEVPPRSRNAHNDDAASDMELGTRDALPLQASTDNVSKHGMGEVFKKVFSAALLVFSIAMVGAAIFTKQTTATSENALHPAVAFVIFWVLLLWLALLEGALNCMVGLKPVDKSLFAASHSLASRATQLAHKGANLERFIVGRQYLDLTIVFTTSFMVSTIEGASVLGLPRVVNDVFLDSGLAVILITIIIGQLVSQINCAHSMLDFANNYIMLASTYMALTVEASGILHAVYLVQHLVTWAAGCTVHSDEPKRTPGQKAFFWGRVFFSTSLLGFAVAISIKALFDGYTTMWESVPAIVSLLLLVFLIGIVGVMEGMQIALFSVVHRPGDLENHPAAKKMCQTVFRGNNLESFLCGRQVCQTIIMFAIARITTIDSGDENMFGVGETVQRVLNSGVLGALISTIIASLSWRIIASNFPISFLSNPLAPFVMWLCFLIERTGICSIAWSIATFQKKLAGYRADSVYLGFFADASKADTSGDTSKGDSTKSDTSSEFEMTDKSSEEGDTEK